MQIHATYDVTKYMFREKERQIIANESVKWIELGGK